MTIFASKSQTRFKDENFQATMMDFPNWNELSFPNFYWKLMLCSMLEDGVALDNYIFYLLWLQGRHSSAKIIRILFDIYVYSHFLQEPDLFEH